MAHPVHTGSPAEYEKCIEVSKRVRWDIDKDVIRGRVLETDKKFLPDGLSLVDQLGFLDVAGKRLFSQVQGRSYANLFGVVERFIAANIAGLSGGHALGDQSAFEALLRFCDEELKHQALFRRIDALAAAVMPPGYRLVLDPDAVARAVLSKSTWAVLALTCHIEIFTQVHYRESIDDDPALSQLWKDVFKFHWKEESQHAILDEMEWAREDARLSRQERDAGVDDLLALVGALDGLLQLQAEADAAYFNSLQGWSGAEAAQVGAVMIDAYRWQYIGSGLSNMRFQACLFDKIDAAQTERVLAAAGRYLR